MYNGSTSLYMLNDDWPAESCTSETTGYVNHNARMCQSMQRCLLMCLMEISGMAMDKHLLVGLTSE